jgi:amidase
MPEGAGGDAQGSGFTIEEASIAELQQRMVAGRETSRSLVQQYLARIDALDQKGPTLRQMIEVNPESLTIADSLDAERISGRIRGPLHGIPILLKDNIETGDQMHTSAGSHALASHTGPIDSMVAQRLRAAGVVLLGKTNMSEWANFRSTHSSSGWSGRGGQGRNPYALDRSPSGSSSGSAAAVAANYCAAAIGTETDGSVTSPAAACSLVGLKPTVGLVGRSGIIPISSSQDTAGPMARSIRDVALLLSLIAGPDPRDRATSDAASHVTDYAKALQPDALKGARLGVPRKHFTGYHPATDRLFEQTLESLKKLGATIVDEADIKTAGHFDESELEVLLFEFKNTLDEFLSSRESLLATRSVTDLIRFNEQHAAQELAFFGQELLEQAARKGPLSSSQYEKARSRCQRLARKEGIDATLRRHDLDALIAPTQGPVWLTDIVNGDPGTWSSFTTPAAVAGYPHLTIPMGFIHGLPVGLSLVGPAWSEAKLLGYGYAIEQALKARQKPTFVASVTTA